MKRFIIVLLTLTLLIGTACAETATQNGVTATFTTDQTVYSEWDLINARLAVTNTTGTLVRNVRMQVTAPDGFQLATGNQLILAELAPGMTQELNVVFTGPESDPTNMPHLPQTGDDSHIGLWLVLLCASLVGFTALLVRNRKANRLLSLFLCVALLSALAPLGAVAAVQTMTLTQRVLFDDGLITLTATVTHGTETPALNMTSAALDKAEYLPGDVIILSGVQVKHADSLQISGNNPQLASTTVNVANQPALVSVADIKLPLPADAQPGAYTLSVTPFNRDGQSGAPATLSYSVLDVIDDAPYTHAILPDGTVQITLYTGTDANVIIPEMIAGRTVTKIGPSAFKGSAVQTVTVPATVVEIEQDAFRNCAQLTTVTMPNSLQIIGPGAFASCVALTTITCTD